MNNKRIPKIMLNYRSNGERRIGRTLMRLLDEAETGLSRPNSWKMMMMMTMHHDSTSIISWKQNAVSVQHIFCVDILQPNVYTSPSYLHDATNCPNISFITVAQFIQHFWCDVIWSSTYCPTNHYQKSSQNIIDMTMIWKQFLKFHF